MSHTYIVSYGHTDIEKTEAILRFFKETGLDIWYDGYIRLYHDWTDEIRDALDHARGLILIATNDAVRRPVVISEVRYMKNRGGQIYVICLETIRTDGLDPIMKDLIEKQQFVMVRRYNTILLRKIAESIATEEILKTDTVLSMTDYINGNSVPRPVYEDGELKYYRIELADILPYSGTLSELDDQWYPPSVYDSGLLYSQDPEERKKIDTIRVPLQVREFYRALLHSRQILVNRAFFQNSPVFRSVYEQQDEKEKEALRSLLNTGALVLVLMNEDPYKDTDYQSDRASWGSFLRTCRPYFMRFDWDSKEFNRRINETTLSEPFSSMMVSLFTRAYTIEDGIRRWNIQDRDGFVQTIRRIGEDARNTCLRSGRYTRTNLYTGFVTKDENSLPEGHPYKGRTVRDTVMDPDKPFARQIKLIGDEVYAMNFAYSHMCDLKSGNMYLQKTDGSENQYSRILYADELTSFLDAILHRTPEVFGSIGTVPLVTLDRMRLSRITALRATPEWETYISHVEYLKKRTYTWSLDIDGMKDAVLSYLAVLKKYAEDERQVPFAFSVTYRLSAFLFTLTVRRNPDTGEFEYLYKTEGVPPKETSMVHIAFEVRDLSETNDLATPEANILICTGITDRSGDLYVQEIRNYLRTQNAFREII